MERTLNEILADAPEDVLEEVLREAESRLEAQLTTAIASDGRAINFLGFLSAIIVAVVGASLAIAETNLVLAAVGLVLGLGLCAAGYFAFEAAKPIDFEMPGNDPSEWAGDVERKQPLHKSMAEQAAHYDGMLKSNRQSMKRSADRLSLSADVARYSLGLGAILSSAYLVAKWIGYLS